MKTIKILFLFVGMLVSSSVSAQEFCSKFFDNNLDVALTAENNPDNTQFRFKNLSNRQVSFIYMGTAVSIGSNSISQWFSGSYPSSSNLDCNSVKIDGYPITNYEYIYSVYYLKYNQYPTLNYDNCSSIITQRKQIIAEIQRLKQTVPAWFASEYGGLNFMIEQSQMTIEQCTRHLSKSSNDENQNSNQTNLKNTATQNYNNYDNNTTSPQQTQTTNSNNGVTMADVQKILDENNRQFEQRLGIKSYANDTEMVNDIAKGVGEIVDLFRANRELDRKEEEQKRAAEESRKLEEAAAQQKVDNRKIIINKFQPKDIPVSSKEKASKIYYFIYAYDNTINNLYGSALMYVSNVFEIGTYDDGTRAYTATINNEIANLTSFKEVLHGYYYTEQEAVKIRESFISLMQNNDVYFTDIYYKGKPTTSTVKSNTTKQENFWGETKNDQNLAPAQINTAKPSELPREEKKKQEEKKKKDFWD